MKLSLHIFLGRRMYLSPFGLYCSPCFGSLCVSILCTCCSHFYYPLLKEFKAARLTKKCTTYCRTLSQRGDELTRTRTGRHPDSDESSQHNMFPQYPLDWYPPLYDWVSYIFSTDNFLLMSFCTCFIKFSCVSSPHLPVISVFSDPNILLFSDTFSLFLPSGWQTKL